MYTLGYHDNNFLSDSKLLLSMAAAPPLKMLTTAWFSRHQQVQTQYQQLETSFRAEYGDVSDGGINVGVMCEYDALPEIGHACGHNLIAQLGIGAGLGIKTALEQSGMKRAKVCV